jgi:hypothetical protein
MAWCCALQPGRLRISANKFGQCPDTIAIASRFALCSARRLVGRLAKVADLPGGIPPIADQSAL